MSPPTHAGADPAMARLAAGLRASARAHHAGHQPRAAGDRALLTALGYQPDHPAPQRANQAALLAAAATLPRLFQLRAAAAPGLFVFGAEIHQAGQTRGVSGTGATLAEAFQSCVGEAVELQAQFPGTQSWRRAPFASLAPPGLLAAQIGLPPRAACDWLEATCLTNGIPSLLPVDLCLRRPEDQRDFTAPFPLSIGCAAGPNAETATLRAVLEVIERDALALWWRGGRRGHALSAESPATREAAALLASLRQGNATRRAWLLDITTDLGVPCIAALSCRADGRGLACGTAARLTQAQAARAAVMEMCQMELAGELVAAKRAQGGTLNPRDRAHLRRETKLRADDCGLLHPLPPRAPPVAPNTLATLLTRLASLGLHAHAVTLTLAENPIPVIRVLVPGLEQEPSQAKRPGPRLAAEIARSGGGRAYTGGVSLM